jgi:Ca2+/Na+ antiporter
LVVFFCVKTVKQKINRKITMSSLNAELLFLLEKAFMISVLVILYVAICLFVYDDIKIFLIFNLPESECISK